ncbi:cytidine deaminase [Desulfofalx alkaliphila]|uniref:cytidine deaminase n=1 Tax=Desulfofalx alkaliphila TaxID=105483 RepID=UPI000A753AFC|nr:cytidine deaminase [Desulfofalx alkaliphila]
MAGTGEKMIDVQGSVYPLEKLINVARAAMNRAYAPYSNFPVGAALITKEGNVYNGCNVENVSYGLTCCAERVAIFKAVADGFKDFKALAVIANTEQPCSPCGACRQVMIEFAPHMEVYMVNKDGHYIKTTAGELLPAQFDKDLLQG